MNERLCFISEGVAIAIPEKQATVALSQAGDYIVSLGDAEWTVDEDVDIVVAKDMLAAFDWMNDNATILEEDDE